MKLGQKCANALFVKRWASNIIICIIAILIGLFLSEMVMRGFVKIKYQFREQLDGVRISPYPGLAYDLEKCSECTVRINSLGLRGDEIDIRKQEDTVRILILGDSATFGAGVISDEGTVPGRLNKLFSSQPPIKGMKFEVINGGVWGYDIQEIYLHYKFKLSKLNSDIIIYNFFPNDFLNARYVVEKINGRPTLVRWIAASMPGLQIIRFLPERFNLFLNEHSLLYRYALFYFSQLWQSLDRDRLDFMDKYQIANLKYLDLLYEEIRRDKAKFAISSEIYSFCARCKEPLDDIRCPTDNGCVDSFKTVKFVEGYCVSREIPYINLSNFLSDMELKDVMVDEHAHYTAKANIIMGDRLYDFIVSKFFSSEANPIETLQSQEN